MPTRKIRLHHFLANDVGVDPDVADFTWERGLVVIVWTRINRNYPEDWQLDKAVKLLNERGLDASWEGWEEPHWMKELAIEGDLAAAGFKRRARDLNASIRKLEAVKRRRKRKSKPRGPRLTEKRVKQVIEEAISRDRDWDDYYEIDKDFYTGVPFSATLMYHGIRDNDSNDWTHLYPTRKDRAAFDKSYQAIRARLLPRLQRALKDLGPVGELYTVEMPWMGGEDALETGYTNFFQIQFLKR